MSQKSWEQRVTAFLLEAAEGLREIAQPSGNDSIKVQIGRAARRAGLSYWRAFDLWYRKARCVHAAEIEAIRAARAARTRERSDEYASLAADFEALAERMSRLSAGSAGADAAAFRAVARRTRRLADGE
ncbi:hypothetical protein SAMN04487843_108229 [Methylobacterium sp. ap11]|nr:hypothetical protein SAMN04487843_108229 [Methylobacterium sp. ap11]